MITLEDYWMGRDKQFAHLLTDELRANAKDIVERANKLLYFARSSGVLEVDLPVNSGWRPPAVNNKVAGASKTSLHMSCKAIDLNDPYGEIDKFCFNNQKILADLGLWLEHPDATPRWCHVQSVPPRSGNRVFKP
jgi:hypothetical protein